MENGKKFEILADNYNEMSKKVSSLENQVDNLKNKFNSLGIREQIRNLINSFSYILFIEGKKI